MRYTVYATGGASGLFLSVTHEAPLLLKAGDIPPGARWITVHPHGDDSKGVPVLIQETQPGSGVHHVIGGAGGKLNYLKLKGVKAEGEYRKEYAEKRALQKLEKQRIRKRDKEMGLDKVKRQAREQVDLQRQQERAQFIKTVSEAMDWDATFDPSPYADLSPQAQQKAYKDHEREWLAKAKEAVQKQRDQLLTDHEAREQALKSADDDPITLEDLSPEPDPSGGLGYAPNYKREAEKHGATADAIAAEKAQLDAGASEEQREATSQRKQTIAAIKAEVDAARQESAAPDAPIKLAEAEKAAKMIKAAQKLRKIEAQAAKAKKDIDKATEAPGPVILKVGSGEIDQAFKDQVENDLRTLSTSGFLEQVKSIKGDTAKHLGVGAYNALNSLGIVAAGAGLMDRSVIDVLGVGAASDVLARRLRNDLGDDEAERIHDALEAYHYDHYQGATDKAIEEAQRWKQAAEDLSPEGEAKDGFDLARMQEVNQKRAEALENARRIMGQTLGEMEGNAAMVHALGRPVKDQVEVALGDMSTHAAVTRARALGLSPGDYQINSVGSTRFLTINGSGLDKLAQPIDKTVVEQTRRALDIQAGKEDEGGWLAEGMEPRADLSSNPLPGVAPRFTKPFAPNLTDVRTNEFGDPGHALSVAINDYIAQRTADGDAPRDIVADLRSDEMARKAGEHRATYGKLIDQFAPVNGADGKPVNPDDLKEMFESLADEYVKETYGTERSAFHKQNVPVDETSVEALHRAFAATPEGAMAYLQAGDLDAKQQKALRDYWWREFGSKDEGAAELRAQLDELVKDEPERMSVDMFGEESESPEWRQWAQQKDELTEKVNASGLSWDKYSKIMGGPHKAYATVQDHIRGRVAERFADTYNRLAPAKAIKIGRGMLAGHLNHLDAVDPAAREKRLEQHREMVDDLRERNRGRYAAGGVADKLAAEAAQRDAFEQAQMGFFMDEEPADKPLEAGQRYTLGPALERTLAGMAAHVGTNFRPGKPVKLWHASMDGKFVNHQRAVKMLENSGRLLLSQGVGSGKAQPLDAKVLTASGWRLMGDLKVGDEVIAADGSAARITNVYPQGEKEIYRVIMRDGGETRCCAEHLWFTQTENERKNFARSKPEFRARHQGQVRSLQEIMETLRGRTTINHGVPIAAPAQTKPLDYIVDPYVLGVLLGDGGFTSNTVMLSNPEPEIINRVAERLPDDLKLLKNTGDGCNYRITSGVMNGGLKTNVLVEEIKRFGLMGLRSADKFIPQEYLGGSVEQRIFLLRGLMDTDGYLDTGGSAVISTSSPRLAEGIVTLLWSLGGNATRTVKKKPSYTYKGEKRKGKNAYVLHLALPEKINPFLLRRKADGFVAKTKYAPKYRAIERVEYWGLAQAQCIAIDHPSHLYVTDDYIVTHNTKMGLAGFAHLHSKGKAQKGLFAVPSVVQGQFGGEALRYLKPGQFKWHAEPGASHEERVAAYKDPENHFTVVTHQALRDDLIKLGAKQAGVSSEALAEQVRGMNAGERQEWMKGLLDAEGINADYLMVDEGHDLLNRAGKQDSLMAAVIDAVAHNSRYYTSASADPVKNDASEIFSALQKLDPKRYNDAQQFKRRYGVDTPAAADALRREMARYHFPGKLDPGVQVQRDTRMVALSEGQQAHLGEVRKAAAAARLARMRGTADVDALKVLSPSSFANVPAERHQEVAEKLTQNLGIIKDSAVRRAIDDHPQSAKLDEVSKIAGERKGKPGVVFAHSLAAVKALHKKLEAEGHRVVSLTGSDSAKEKDAKRRAFHPEQGEPSADILVASDAAAVGLNLQRGQWLAQYDTPQTAKTWHQRNGRIHRIGQKNNVELIDLVGDHASERRARDRLQKKDALREILTSPLDGMDDTGLASYLHRATVDEQQSSLF